MKRVLVTSLAVIMVVSTFALSAFGFFGFGYTHGIPGNDGKLYAGFDFGPDEAEFNIDLYLRDVWMIDNGVYLGIQLFYDVDTELLDLKAGGYLESTSISSWPSVGTGDAGLYVDSVFHLLPAPCGELNPCGSVSLDLIANFQLAIDAFTGDWLLGGEIGFEVEI